MQYGWGKEKCIQNFSLETSRNDTTWDTCDNVGIDLRAIGFEVLDWTKVVKNKVQWRGFVDTVIETCLP